jgi:hypothetical protein
MVGLLALLLVKFLDPLAALIAFFAGLFLARSWIGIPIAAVICGLATELIAKSFRPFRIDYAIVQSIVALFWAWLAYRIYPRIWGPRDA